MALDCELAREKGEAGVPWWPASSARPNTERSMVEVGDDTPAPLVSDREGEGVGEGSEREFERTGWLPFIGSSR